MGFFNFLKKIASSPPRHSVKHRRSYDGARRGRLHKDWFTWGSSANSEINGSLTTLRNRSRDLLRNNDYARGMVRHLTNNVVYTGIGFQAQVKEVKNPIRNADRINNLIESKFKMWADNPNYCDVSGCSNFNEIQRLAMSSFLESGEVFIRKVKQSFSDSAVPFALEVIEADQCAEDYNSTHDGNQIIMGVEIDRWKRPLAYWFYSHHPGDFLFGTNSINSMGGGANSRSLTRIPASEIIHLYIRERPNQLRGVPILYSTINRLRNLGEYEKNELVASRMAASVMGIVTLQDYDLLKEPNIESDKQDLPGDEEFSPGTIRYMPTGSTFEGFNPTRPNSAFATFFESQLRGSGAGVGVSYENVSNDYSKSNYSSSRLSLLQARDVYKVLQVWFISSFLRDIYNSWLDAAVLYGVLPFSDYEIRPERYRMIRWTPRGWSWVDPHKEINATIAAIKAGLTTLSEEVAKQGGDFEENIKILARERDILEQYGVKLDLDSYPVENDNNGEEKVKPQ